MEKSFQIEFNTETGKSGINLDEVGFHKGNGQVTAWVLDGVSPIFFKESDKTRLFQNFQKASFHVNESFKNYEWTDVINGIEKLKSKILSSDNHRLFEGNIFYQTPLFSCGIVQVQKKHNDVNIKIALYGDCVVIVDDGEKITKYEYANLERLKTFLNRIFIVSDKIFSATVNTIFKKLVFICIRFFQIKFGVFRVFSVKDNFAPAIIQNITLPICNTSVIIVSDGLSWYFKNDSKKLKAIVETATKYGADSVIKKIRNDEIYNRDFGRLDDASILLIKW